MLEEPVSWPDKDEDRVYWCLECFTNGAEAWVYLSDLARAIGETTWGTLEMWIKNPPDIQEEYYSHRDIRGTW